MLCVASTASADEPLFEKGRVSLDVMGADVPFAGGALGYSAYVGPLTISSYSSKTGEGTSRLTSTSGTYGIAPSADWFITDHLTLGGRAVVAWETNHLYDASGADGRLHTSARGLNVDLGPRIGYAIPIFSSLGFWPRVSGGVIAQHLTSHEGDTEMQGFFVTGNFGLVARFAPHVLLEFGPELTYVGETSGSVNTVLGHLSAPRTSSTDLELTAKTAFRVDF